MQTSNQLIDLTDQEVARRCHEESEQRQANPLPSYCYELFRRAINGGSQAAWDAIYKQYEALIHSWIGKNDTHQEDLIQESYAKFIHAFQNKYELARFPTISAVIGIWRTITKNVVIDQGRAQEREQRNIPLLAESIDGYYMDGDIEQLDRQKLIQKIEDLLKDDEERRVFEARFGFDMKPAEIAQKYPEHFDSSEAVSTIVERIKLRLKRNKTIQQLLDDMGFW